MHILFSPFNQPAQLDGFVEDVQIIGKPVYKFWSTIVRFIKYGAYRIDEVENQDTLTPLYRLRLVERYVGSPTIVPAGTVAYIEEENLTTGTLPYTAIRYLDLQGGPDYQSVDLSGNITFFAQRHMAGKSVVVKVRNLSGTVSRNLTFSNSWIFLGAKPASIGPSKTGILSITSFGDSDDTVIAVWAVQSD